MSSSSSSSSSSSFSCHYFTLDEIKEATNNFDEEMVIGHGGEGKVYLANISLFRKNEKTPVAVKHLKPNSSEFEKEIQTISKIHHPNLVSLLGYCQESGQKILVYEYMQKGSLSDYVKKKKIGTTNYLPWKLRLNICIGAARGLQHLHTPTEELPKGIIHRDIKPANILLAESWVAKVSDFGLFKLSHAGQTHSRVITDLKGTCGYYAPENFMHNQISRKIDVYAFGVVMFEVLCRKSPWDRGEESYFIKEDDDLGLWARENVDTEIKEEISGDSLVAFTDIIRKCLQRDPTKRPTMDDMVLDLESALKCQEHRDELIHPKSPSFPFLRTAHSTNHVTRNATIQDATFARTSSQQMRLVSSSIDKSLSGNKSTAPHMRKSLRCCSCERMEAWDTKYLLLEDGRKLCPECLDSAIMDTNECQPLYLEIQEFYERLNMKIEQQVPLLLVESQALNKAKEGETNLRACYQSTKTQGLILSEEKTVGIILRRPKIEADKITDIFTEPYRLICRGKVKAILILYSFPRLWTGAILVHEMMHAWLRLEDYPSLSPKVEEGMCEVLVHMWLTSEILECSGSSATLTSSASSSSSAAPALSKKGKMSSFEKQLGEYFKYKIESNTSSDYGDGFREGKEAVLKYGLQRTLDHIKVAGKFPS